MAKHLVIMAGGIGSRFWPMSTPQYPKQFIDITGCGRTMIQQTFDRFGTCGEHAEPIIDIDHVWVVTSANYKALVEEQLHDINPQHILLEPCMRNTAPCVAYVSWKIQREDPEALIVVAPSDHLVLNVPAFQATIRKGLDFVSAGNRILTLGMTPTRPETGYGYIEQGEEAKDSLNSSNSACAEPVDVCSNIHKLKAFREKPNLTTAIEYLQKGGFTWNSGMFLWGVNTIVSELRAHAPQIAGVMDQMVDSFFTDKEQQLVNELFPTCEKISIDYAVMEKTKMAYVMPAEFGWSDLGTWGSLHTLSDHDENNNAVIGNNISLIECSGCMVHIKNEEPSPFKGDKRGSQVVIQGLKNCIVSEHNGTLLICQLSEEQRIKEWHE